MVGKGRPVIGRTIELRLPHDMIAALDAEAERSGVKRSELIRSIIERHVTKAKRSRPS